MARAPRRPTPSGSTRRTAADQWSYAATGWFFYGNREEIVGFLELPPAVRPSVW